MWICATVNDKFVRINSDNVVYVEQDYYWNKGQDGEMYRTEILHFHMKDERILTAKTELNTFDRYTDGTEDAPAIMYPSTPVKESEID